MDFYDPRFKMHAFLRHLAAVMRIESAIDFENHHDDWRQTLYETMSLAIVYNGIIPARFLALLAHLSILVTLLSDKVLI